MIRILVLSLLLCLGMLGWSHDARAAVTCTLSGPTIAFGSINPTMSAQTASGTGTFTCSNSGTASVTIYACLSLGTGSGGISASDRTLLGGESGSAHIPITISNPGIDNNNVGDGTVNAMAGPINFTVASKSAGGGNIPLSVQIAATGTIPQEGDYSSTLSGTSAEMIYTTSAKPTSCPSLVSGTNSTASMTLAITASIPTTCSVTAGNLVFGSAGVLATAVSTSASVGVTCNTSNSVIVSIDNGSTGTSPTSRLMTSGSNSITYGIYQDSGHTKPWGSTSGTNTESLGGSGTLTAYGLVPAQASPVPGNYADVVNVAVAY